MPYLFDIFFLLLTKSLSGLWEYIGWVMFDWKKETKTKFQKFGSSPSLGIGIIIIIVIIIIIYS